MKELLRKAYEDGQLFGNYVDFEYYYQEEYEDKLQTKQE
jgi:hypothetical protein